MWVTNNFLKDGLQLMEDLGFRYITNIVWVKNRFGLGQYFRGQHELMLFGVKGKFHRNKIPDSSCASVIHAKRRKHSQKPVEQYTRIESISAGPYLELFARSLRMGWSSWGNEAESNSLDGQTRLLL
jgi:N6-adenosine-specific RNA methylase IME4